MQITLSPEQEQRLRIWIIQQNAAHWNADAEPPGYELVIDSLASPWGCEVSAVDGSNRMSLGTVALTWSTPL
jgi:hypothetical protein